MHFNSNLETLTVFVLSGFRVNQKSRKHFFNDAALQFDRAIEIVLGHILIVIACFKECREKKSRKKSQIWVGIKSHKKKNYTFSLLLIRNYITIFPSIVLVARQNEVVARKAIEADQVSH